ncbi:YlxR family protein [Corynebacterium gerontici]|uniref:YlxR family protein n=1 Tax=Corynebacterium gerontici TaxID=2079234 RepID=UPI001FEA279E|nr:YlxR family protein [Corynebacterium gerontici]
MPEHTIQRTCIATRTTTDPQHLLRLVSQPIDGTCFIVPDPQRKLGGRGAWITPTVEALEEATRRRAFARAFRVSMPIDTGHVRDYLLQHDPDPCKEDTTLMSTP